MITDQRKEEIREEFAYYLGEGLGDFDYSEHDGFIEEFEIEDEELNYLRSLRYTVVVEEIK